MGQSEGMWREPEGKVHVAAGLGSALPGGSKEKNAIAGLGVSQASGPEVGSSLH